MSNTHHLVMHLHSFRLHIPITAVTLPEVTTGNMPVSYTITPDPPAGLDFNASARELSGAPTDAQEATDYTYTAEDANGDEVTLTFTIEVIEPVPAGLIPINTLEQLNAMRLDLNTDGEADDSDDAAAYAAVFPGLLSTNVYTGYELARNLDFQDNNSYSNIANKVNWEEGDGTGWTPIGLTSSTPFTGIFDGGGHTITNLYINSNVVGLGLFGTVNGVIRNVGIVNPNVTGGSFVSIGGLVGSQDGGTISACYVSGATLTGENRATVGGLSGGQSGTISACYVSGGTIEGGDRAAVGGLVGSQFGTISACYVSGGTIEGGDRAAVGSLIGDQSGTIIACYAGGADYTSLRGNSGGPLTNSYYQAATTQDDNDATDDIGARTATELQTPTAYNMPANNIYADWNVDIDGDTNADDPWDFGTGSQYPVLNIDFNASGGTADDVTRQRGG